MLYNDEIYTLLQNLTGDRQLDTLGAIADIQERQDFARDALLDQRDGGNRTAYRQRLQQLGDQARQEAFQKVTGVGSIEL